MAQPRINFVHPLLRARDYQNRPEFDRLCDWWRGGGQGVCALVGIGGAGKTAVADRFLRVLPGAMADDPNLLKDDTLPSPAALFVFSFYDAPNPDAFVAELGAWLDDRPPDDSKKKYSYEQMLRLLHGGGDCLLVLDGLEKVQDPGLRGGAFGQITDGRLRDFILRVAEGTLPGVRVIITTRFRLYDPLAERCPLYFPIAVERLDARAAVALLRKRGVHRGTDGQLEAVAREQGFHALSVDLAGGYIAHFCKGDPSRLPPDPHDRATVAADATLDPRIAAIQEQERKFARLAERYQEALSQSDPAAMALLQRVCLFRLGVDAKTLASVFTGDGKEEISGPELAQLSLADLAAKLQKLAAMRLIEVSGSEKGEDSSFSIHPAVRGGFLAGLDAETAQRGHDAARHGLEASLGGQSGDNPSDPATLDLLEEIVYHTLAAGHAQEAFDIYWHRIGGYNNLGGRLGAYERGERICRAFAAGRPPQTAPLPDGLSKNDQVVLINAWALYLKDLGRLDAAAQGIERHNEMQLVQESWANASRGYVNLSEVSLSAGHLAAGLRAAEEALGLAERAGDAKSMCASYASCGHARALRGETDAASTDFRDALHCQHKDDGKTDRPLWSLRGIRHSLLLIRQGSHEEARRLTKANHQICMELVGQGYAQHPLVNLLLADLARERGDLPTAREFLAEAHEWAIARDAREPLCWSAMVRARIELAGWASPTMNVDLATDLVGDPHLTEAPKALTDAIEDGLRIARDCGYGIYHIDLLLLRARAALHEGRPADAERDVRLALDEGVHPAADTGLPELLAATDKECGYAWGIAEARHLLAEALLLQAAQNLGSQSYKPRARNTPPEVREQIKLARVELQKCARLRKRIQDPKQKDTKGVLDRLNGGVLTSYPLKAVPETSKRQSEIKDPGMPTATSKRFEVALSFPGERRDFVSAVAGHLTRTLGKERVFYDKNFEAELARPNLDTYLQAIYHDQSELIAIFLCGEYEKKEWCGLEWRAIRDLLKQRQAADIMPFRFDGTHIPGLFSIDGYVSLKDKTPVEVADLIGQRLLINRTNAG
ncbi:MAG: TIR domain-containing protein [Planctomycetota bacterium]|nr:TIR domain-containing protein [Planctomycetota bacterium]